ncbi:hypothetical protein A3I27_00990 [Candidatus Giovannonibacteria bacterium RIFCSPLOWO2_02_FULL_43_11b]|uniref:Uncharacterized protein n=1 Tax=Candidatus Giovannonibacteria bacterium RIFCSPHIGHO2_12_FULL_43_15 TaxID=1798341 RepID=A0A1F5WPG0_9BACT|nr:MAG: hypothetical protein A2739_01195 [Candidatus Giovannonibacteria bacterium RIFCSPHIGHO2_01_FULL_43_100]OGF66770.1 MAG: hypothetical protein A3B97_02555 [Candidatus Giovannonibacteria bacterium RIFCSPHIGHO2_02_FULL_43_32]OGF77546.1 MAG: hypothetical protein A3F23_01050 [Candidatus Giovannonibacteria bacterium RIFCSPHIGHO2_12_FULL_43_15]OGF79007.1 MAG: hypothetical protein A3A15_00675 [Candidatus Giovannonibacteria bacterium RIFCSPLOWO2_01_FULL_43_60]OGF90379.1 MAG: hypothetical protein A3
MLFFTKREANEKIGNKGHVIKTVGNLAEGMAIKVSGSKSKGNSRFALKIRGIKNCETIEEELNKTQYVKHVVEVPATPTFSTKNPPIPEVIAFRGKLGF